MFAYDPDTLFPGTSIPNGRVVAKTNDHDEAMLWAAGGVAEGTEIFTSQPIYNDWTYLMAARNPWDQPSYQIVYRRTTGGIESLHLPWGGVPSGANERVLLASNWVQKWDGNREKTDRTNFGGAEHFRAYGREYIICHKLSNTDDPINTARELLIKELTWDTQSPSQDDGIIFRLFDGYPSKYLDVNWFAGPNVLGLSSPPVP